MKSKIVTEKSLILEKVENKKTVTVPVFAGDADYNIKAKDAKPLFNGLMTIETPQYKDSKSEYDIWNEFHEMRARLKLKEGVDISTMNAAEKPSDASIASLIGQFFFDVTRRAEQLPDLTSKFAEEITDLNFPKAVTLQEFYEYLGEFQLVFGANDSVPLVEQFLGETDSVTLDIYGLGWKTVLANILFNPIHNLQKVSNAVSKAYTDFRNSRTIGTIVGATFDTGQQQAAVEISGATYDVNLYWTIRQGIKKLISLLDVQTDRRISTSKGIKILCNSVDAWDIERVVFGQLVTAGTNGTITAQNVQALPIDEIIVYDQGMTNGRVLGGKTLSFPGVTEGTFYLYVPNDYFKVLTKRGLTMETGRGSVLNLSQEEKSWYSVGGIYYKPFLGSSHADWTGDSGYGAIVECEMPTAIDAT